MGIVRLHGRGPYAVAVVHGGPGAPGSVAPVAAELAAHFGVLEPHQSETTVAGQAAELCTALTTHGSPPMVLIGHSWGAWLALLVAACHPELVRKLVLVSSGAFKEHYAAELAEARLGRLDQEERREFRELLAALDDPASPDKNRLIARLGCLASKADDYAPLEGPAGAEPVDPDGEVYRLVWGEAARLRGSGELLRLAGQVTCPVVAVHGDYDPSPAEGVSRPLAAVLADFRFVLLERCGHTPWKERYARDAFYSLLRAEIAASLATEESCG